MESALATIDFSNLPAVPADDDVFNELAKGSDFLGRLTLFSGKHKQVEKGIISPGRYGIPDGDDVIDLGPQVDILPLARRAKAMDFNDKPVVTCYNPADEVFQQIVAGADAKQDGCQYGPSFLVIERSSGRILEYFLGSKTHRKEAKKIYPALPLTAQQIEAKAAAGADVSQMEPHGPLPLTLKGEFVETEAFSWWVPVVLECSAPFTHLPSAKAIQAELTRFLSPKQQEEEVTDADASQRRAR